jgi:hypothetical protein
MAAFITTKSQTSSIQTSCNTPPPNEIQDSLRIPTTNSIHVLGNNININNNYYNSPSSAALAASNSALAASSLLHSAADMQLSGMTNFSSLAQVCGQYGSAAAASAVSPASFSAASDGLYSAAAIAAAASASHNTALGVTESSSLIGTSSASSTPTTGIASFGFTQEQVACVCEVLEQSGNIDRLAR